MSSTAAIHVVLTQDFLAARGQRAGFLLLGGFLVWLFIRTSARLIRNPKITWWPGSVHTKGGLHIHHLVWGIVVVLISGFLNFALSPGGVWLDVLAVLFGIGAGLTLDEYVLWLRLDDVYWSEEGRSSVDAVIAAATAGAMVLVAVPRIEVSGSAIATVAPVALILTYCVMVGAVAVGQAELAIGALALPAGVTQAGPCSGPLRAHAGQPAAL
jgi:hypothetical protein